MSVNLSMRGISIASKGLRGATLSLQVAPKWPYCQGLEVLDVLKSFR